MESVTQMRDGLQEWIAVFCVRCGDQTRQCASNAVQIASQTVEKVVETLQSQFCLERFPYSLDRAAFLDAIEGCLQQLGCDRMPRQELGK